MPAQHHIDRAGEIDAQLKLFTQRAADLNLHLFALQRVDVQRAIQSDIERPVIGQPRGAGRVYRALVGVNIQHIQFCIAVDTADLEQHCAHGNVGIAGQTQLFAAKLFDIQIQRQMNIGHLRQHRLREEIFQRFTQRLFVRFGAFDFRFNYLFLGDFRHFRQRNQHSL